MVEKRKILGSVGLAADIILKKFFLYGSVKFLNC